jgi:uncharacterized protein (TIGR02145 family)
MKTKHLVIVLLGVATSFNLVAQVASTFTDSRDGKTYKTIEIGTQTWMAENLAYKVSDGCWGYPDNIPKGNLYGLLYSWNTAISVCPEGWHLPSFIEWTTLINFLGGESVAGGKLKESGTVNWPAPNTGANNMSGFTALPGSMRSFDGSVSDPGIGCYWWSATEDGSDAKSIVLYGGFDLVSLGSTMKGLGFSVRCIKD